MNRASNLLRTSILTQVTRRGKAYTGEIKGTMNDLPSPQGCWKTNYEAKQRKYNAHLFVGLSFLTVTLLFGHATDMFYMNATAPSQPGPKNNYKGT